MATAETRRVPGKWFVIGFVAVTAVTASVFLTIQFSGRGAATRNYVNLSYTAGLRDLEEGYYLDAVKNLTPVVESDTFPAASGFRGEAFLRLKRFTEAEKDFRAAIDREPGLPANHAGLGAALAAQDRQTEAVDHFDTALDLFKNGSKPGRVRRTGDTMDEVRRLRTAAANAMSAKE